MDFHSSSRPGLFFSVLGCSLALNLAFVLQMTVFPDGNGVDDSDREDQNDRVTQVASGGEGLMDTAAPLMEFLGAGSSSNADSESDSALNLRDGWKVTEAKVSHSLSRTFARAVGADGPALSAVFARLFAWDVDLRKDLLAGDRVEVLWRKDKDDKVEIAAARLHTARHGSTLSAYRWQKPGDSHDSYWWDDGTESAMRLKASPMKTYEQITALLKDRPTHAGMDFKADTGTPVVSSYAGTVTRVNWQWKGNGNCVEVRYADGVMAKFLHLSEITVEVGQKVGAGQTLALSGNTGRSTAPHLHYQVERRGHVIDPVDYHGTVRRKLSENEMKRFRREMSRLEGLLGGELASR